MIYYILAILCPSVLTDWVDFVIFNSLNSQICTEENKDDDG
ncbi:MAG: hypothetical protein ACI90V_003249, partial [Bacillariaceae sp.]